MFFKVSHKMGVDNVFKDFTWNRDKGDGTIGFFFSFFRRRPTPLHALWELVTLSNLHTPAVLMLIYLITGYCGGSY